MNTSFDMYRSVSSKSRKRDEITHPISTVLANQANSTSRGHDNITCLISPSRKSQSPLSVPATGSYRLGRSSLREIYAPSSLVILKYTGRRANELKDIRLFKSLVNYI